MTPAYPDPLAAHWAAAVERHDIRAELEAVYADVASEIAARGPACWASGRCCNFERTGHRLYVTGLEAAYCLAGLATRREHAAPSPQVGLPHPLKVIATPATTEPIAQPLSARTLADARARGGCPMQVGHLCGAHHEKPLGCRVYFCDRTAQAWQQDLTERQLARVRSLHERHGIAYRYGEWRAMLERFLPTVEGAHAP